MTSVSPVPLLIVECVCVCDKLSLLFCVCCTSNTLPFSTFCAWCEICKCSPFAETLPDWQRDTSVASPLSVTHQSSAKHLSHSMTPPAARRRVCARPSSKPVGESAAGASSLVREWEEQHHISSPPAQDLSHAFWSLVSPDWEQASVTSVCQGFVLCDTLVVACRDYFVNIVWQNLSLCYFF